MLCIEGRAQIRMEDRMPQLVRAYNALAKEFDSRGYDDELFSSLFRIESPDRSNVAKQGVDSQAIGDLERIGGITALNQLTDYLFHGFTYLSSFGSLYL